MLFVDTALPFGLRWAPKVYTAVADTLEWMVNQEVVGSIIHYLEGFFFVGAPDSKDCVHSLNTFLTTCNAFGVPIAWDKLEGPTSVLTFLGIETDDIQAMQIWLPEVKLAEQWQLITVWRGMRSCKTKELELLVGKLQHACAVVQLAGNFCVVCLNC